MPIESLKWFDKIISDVLDSVYASLNERIERSVKARKIPALRKAYLDALHERVRYIHLPHISIPREIIELFVELYVFRSVRRWQLSADSKPETDLSTTELLKQHKHLFILGEPGAGKTTFMRRVAYSICAHDAFDSIGITEHLFPVLIECRHAEVPAAFDSYDKRMADYDRRVEDLRHLPGPEAVAARKKLRPPPEPLIIIHRARARSLRVSIRREVCRKVISGWAHYCFCRRLGRNSLCV